MSDTSNSINRRPLDENARPGEVVSDLNCLWGVVARMRRETAPVVGIQAQVNETARTLGRVSLKVDELVRGAGEQAARIKLLERHDLEANPVLFRDMIERQGLQIEAQQEQLKQLATALAGVINRDQDAATTIQLIKQDIINLMANDRALRAELDRKTNITFRKGPQAGDLARGVAFGEAAPLPDITDAVKAAAVDHKMGKGSAPDVSPFGYSPYGVAPIQRMDPIEAWKLRARHRQAIATERKACEARSIEETFARAKAFVDAANTAKQRGKVIDVNGCSRCAGKHIGLVFHKLQRSMEVGDGTIYSYYAPCPINGEPIMMAIEEKPEPVLNAPLSGGGTQAEEAAETCIVCGGKEPCSHDFDKIGELCGAATTARRESYLERRDVFGQIGGTLVPHDDLRALLQLGIAMHTGVIRASVPDSVKLFKQLRAVMPDFLTGLLECNKDGYNTVLRAWEQVQEAFYDNWVADAVRARLSHLLQCIEDEAIPPPCATPNYPFPPAQRPGSPDHQGFPRGSS